MIEEILVGILNVTLVIMWVVVTAIAVFHWYGMSAEVGGMYVFWTILFTAQSIYGLCEFYESYTK